LEFFVGNARERMAIIKIESDSVKFPKREEIANKTAENIKAANA
jgi:hypothetical protein